MFLVSSCSGLCAIYWSQLLSGESRCSWSSANRRCTNYIRVINNFIAYKGVTYIKYLMVGCHDVVTLSNSLTWCYPGTMITKFNWCHVTLQLINIFFNSLAPGRFEWNFRYIIFKRILVIDVWGISCRLALIWMSLNFTDDQSTLVQVMAWCRQATSHYPSQYWPRSLSAYGVTRPQWVNKYLKTQNN